MSRSPTPSAIPTTPSRTPSYNFQVIFGAALNAYKKQTKQDLATHPLSAQLQACNSPSAILNVLHDQVDQFNRSRSGDERLNKWLNPTVNVLYAFSEVLGEGIGLVFSPAKLVFTGVGVLLLAAKDVDASQDALVDVFEHIEYFFRRLETFTEVPQTPAMTDITVKIMVEVLDILAIATKEIKQSRAKKYLRKLAGQTDIEDKVKRLDRLTNEQARMANAQLLKVTHGVDDKLTEVGDGVKGVNGEVRVVREKVKVVDDKLQEIIDDVKEVKATAMGARHLQKTADVIDEEKRDLLLRWQSPPDPSTNHNLACDYRHEGSAEWFFQDRAFEEWIGTGSLLWIHGKPGSGKSIISSAIIENIKTLADGGLASMAYFYFDFRDIDKQARSNLLSSLLIQLSDRSNPRCDVLSRLYAAHDNGARHPNDSVLMQCLMEMLTLPNQGPTYVILDALDECPSTSGIPSARKQVLDLVKDLVSLQLPNLHICVTSRPEVDIEAALAPLAFRQVSLHDENGQNADIANYIKSIVYSDSDTAMGRWRSADKDLVIETLSERADGMFRWVFCQLETLQNCLPQSIRRTLRELPKSLDETYERILKEIGKANQHEAHRLLECLAVANRPLRVEELAEVLTLDFDEGEEGIPRLNKDWRGGDRQQAVLSACSSLIIMVDDFDSRFVLFSHFSVREFLTSKRLSTSKADISEFYIPINHAHTTLAKACLGILLQLDDSVDNNRVESNFPLAVYAAQHWVDHAQVGDASLQVEDGMRRLFDPTKPYFSAWLQLYDIDNEDWSMLSHYDPMEPSVAPLYYASLCGFLDLASHLIAKHPHLVNATGGANYSPLGAALQKRHFRMAELLHQHGTAVDVTGYDDRTLLQDASAKGLVDVVRWLLDHGANANSQQEDLSTPLHLAAMDESPGVVRMLLERGASVNVANEDGHTPLHEASRSGRRETVQLLLQHGANISALDGSDSTPLHLASQRGHAETVQCLIDHGADVHVRDGGHSTSLHLASESTVGSAKTVQHLLEHGADVNARNASNWTPLHLAVRSESAGAVQQLLQHGADVNAQDEHQLTPLHIASSSEWTADIVPILLQYGADVNAKDKRRSTPLHKASGRNLGSVEIVRVLLQYGADVGAEDDDGMTPLDIAFSEEEHEKVELLSGHRLK